MATVKELKATARPKSGKGAARAERRAGRVPGVIYGDNQPPVTISVDDRELRQRILAGRFLTTLFDIDLEGKKHRVIPRDYHLDPVKDFPLHGSDFSPELKVTFAKSCAARAIKLRSAGWLRYESCRRTCQAIQTPREL